MNKKKFKYLNAFLISLCVIYTIIGLKKFYLGSFLIIILAIEIHSLWINFISNRELKMLVSNLKKFRETNKGQKILVQRKSELTDLLLEVNNMIETYEELKIKKKQNEIGRRKLISNLSHDIRTPLTSIIGYIDALKDGVVTTPDEQKEFIDILSMKASNLKELTDQIFNVAKIDSDDELINLEYIELNEFLRNTIIGFIPQLEKYKIELVNEIKEEKYMIYADRISLTRIFQNIIKNAIQHGRDGKVLGIRTRVSNRYFRVVIWDRGKGIPKAKQKYIFERLFKVDDSRQTESSNSGLGMSISKKLIEKHNGNIFVKSEENKLTEFFIELPILKELNI